MYKRSELRHACFRAKNKSATEDNKILLAVIEPLLNETQRFENFTEVWDILLDRKKNIVVIKPESDNDFIKTVCQEKSFQIKYKTEPDEKSWTDRHQNIVVIVEALMLDNLMTWETYNVTWGVEVDTTLKQINTKLFVKLQQKEVTEEMIVASMDSPESTEYIGPQINTVEATPMSKEEIKKFESFLKTQEKNKD
jgi:hypothetical protein